MSKEIKSVDYGLEKIFEGAQDFLPLLGTDYVELYVGNAKQAAHYYKTAFGFQSLAYKGLETGSRNEVSYVLKQDKIRLVLTTPLNSKSPVNEHIVKHGDGVKVVALWVDDARSAYEETTKRGARSFMECQLLNKTTWRSRTCWYLYLRGNCSYVCRTKELQRSVFARVSRMEARLQPIISRIEIYRPHGW